MMARQWVTMSGSVIDEDGTEEYVRLDGSVISEDQAVVAVTIKGTIIPLRRRRRSR